MGSPANAYASLSAASSGKETSVSQSSSSSSASTTSTDEERPSSPLITETATGASASSPVGHARYNAAPEQSVWNTTAVLMRKHLILGWRRKRFNAAIVRVGVMVAVPMLIWHGQDPRTHENVRGPLAVLVMPLLGVILVIAMFTQFVVEVVTDKELKMRYVQQVAGVSNTMYWCSYYLFYFILTNFAVVLYLLSTMWIAPIYRYSNGFLMYLSFSATFLQTFFLSMMVSTVISRARMAGVICAMMGAITVGVFYAYLPLVSTRSLTTYFAQSLVPFIGPLNLLMAIGSLEKSGPEWGDHPPGFTWSSFYTPISAISETGQMRLQPAAGQQFFILLADCLIYGLFAAWFDQVYQGEFGAAKPLTFFLDPAFWFPQRRSQGAGSGPALRLVDLVKSFGSHRAVDGMSLEVHRAEIFALLGHNGAGKTTAVNCITGMLPITSGSAEVCGIDVATDLQEARRRLSVCPQDNPLYFEFTVDEHLSFFAALRGVPPAEASVAINDALQALDLTEKRNARVVTLSGGQKRRLWVATSLMGETPVVFLDEPTSGMDPANRRKLWDLLVSMKASGRCILFTTHYLDEADVLAERKAVLDKGKVKAVGTSMELKREFGLGYHLRVIGIRGASAEVAGKVRQLVQSHIPSATDEVVREEDRAQAHDAPSMWSFILPYEETERFGPLLMDIERQAGELQVTDFSMETTTLEEVFMALGQDSVDSSGMEGQGQAVDVVVPAGFDCSRPMQVSHPETQQQVEVRLPEGAQPGQTYNVVLPTPVADVDLVGPQERVPVTWDTHMEAVHGLRWQQLFRNKRSLLATLVVPVGLIVFCAWGLSMQMRNFGAGGPGSTASGTAQAAGVAGMGAGLWMSICLAIPLPYFATTLVLDRVSRCLYVATSQGLQLSAYWVGTFLNNYLHFLLVALMVPTCMVVFEVHFYSEVDILMQYVWAALFCPVPMLLFAYNASRLFSSAEACSKFMPSVSILASLMPVISLYVLTLLGGGLQISAVVGKEVDEARLAQGKNFHKWAVILHWTMSFLDPFYLLPGTFAAIGLTQLAGLASQISKKQGIEVDLLFPSIGGSYVAVPLLGAVTLSIALSFLLAWEADRSCNLLAQKLRHVTGGAEMEVEMEDLDGLPHASGAGDQEDVEAGEGRAQTSHSVPQDADVLQEQQRVASASRGSYAVMYKNLVHTYNEGSSREVRAVRGISLGVSPGECFCLLGPNGAGKTTTLDVLTGAIFPPTQGEVRIGRHSATGSPEERLAALQLLGNCPQVDPLWPTLTGRQHLLFYAQVKGLPPHLCEPQAAALLRALGFSDFDADKPTSGYSGGMRRKLSLAMALIGSPPTMLLDEPSAAVDVAAKRHLWRVVKRRKPGQTVILTTHSMEEAEALSDRLAIQVRGRLRCIGTPDHLKMTHGAGYQLEMLTKNASQAGVEEFVKSLSPSARLLESHEGRFLFQLPVLRAVGAKPGELSLASLFLKMQEATHDIGLRDYAISRPTLEQVFLRLAREQNESEE